MDPVEIIELTALPSTTVQMIILYFVMMVLVKNQLINVLHLNVCLEERDVLMVLVLELLVVLQSLALLQLLIFVLIIHVNKI